MAPCSAPIDKPRSFQVRDELSYFPWHRNYLGVLCTLLKLDFRFIIYSDFGTGVQELGHDILKVVEFTLGVTVSANFDEPLSND